MRERGWCLPLCKQWKNKCFLVVLYSLLLNKPSLEVATKRFHICRYSFSAMSHMEVCLDSHFCWHVCFWESWMSFITTNNSQWGPQKLLATQGLVKDWWLNVMAILSKVCKPDHFEWHNSLKPGFTNIWALHSNFDGCESFLEANSSDILTLCKRKIADTIYSGNFSVRDFLHFIWKDSITFKPGLTAYVKLISNLLSTRCLVA